VTAPGQPPARFSATVVLLAVFVLGLVAGASLFWLAGPLVLGPPRGRPPEPPVAHLVRELSLTPEQAERLRTIFEESRTRMHAQAEATRERIREILTPDQRERFDRMGPPPPPPGFPPPPGGPPGPRPGPHGPRSGLEGTRSGQPPEPPVGG
jgi:hypothetical protein